MSMLSEFRDFAVKGNVIDLAVAVIIGAAFGKIVDSLVKDIFLPLVSTILPGGGYQNWTATINGAQVHYGNFLAEIVNFLVVAFALFFTNAVMSIWPAPEPTWVALATSSMVAGMVVGSGLPPPPPLIGSLPPPPQAATRAADANTMR